MLDEVLIKFQGVLVSDFYSAYDSIPCSHQKCLIHLLRDLNSALHGNPFDIELKELAKKFGATRILAKPFDLSQLLAAVEEVLVD